MVTSLIAGAAIPVWDRDLVAALWTAAQAAERDVPIRHMAVINDDGAIYRRVIADGQQEFVMLLRCFEARGFDMRVCGDEVVASLAAKVSPTE
jgi:hypothetical protein